MKKLFLGALSALVLVGALAGTTTSAEARPHWWIRGHGAGLGWGPGFGWGPGWGYGYAPPPYYYANREWVCRPVRVRRHHHWVVVRRCRWVWY